MKGDGNTIVITTWNVIYNKWHLTKFVKHWYIFTCIPKILIEWCNIQFNELTYLIALIYFSSQGRS